MTTTRELVPTSSNEELAFKIRRFTPKQQAHMKRLDSFPWKLWTSNEKFFATVDRYWAMYLEHVAQVEEQERLAELAWQEQQDAEERRRQEQAAQDVYQWQRHYWDTVSRVTSYDGPDYRVQLQGEGSTWVRASKPMFVHAVDCGLPTSIGVPETVAAA